MRIAIFTNNYLPNPYGVSTSVETFRRELERLGHTVYIFAPHWYGYEDKNPNVFRYPSLDFKFLRFRFPLPIPFSFKMHKILKNLTIDVIHAQHPNLLGWAAWRLAKRKKIPLIFTWHTLYDRYVGFAPFVPRKLATKFIIKNAAEYANRAGVVIVPTDSILPILREWGMKNEKVVPIATGVAEEDFENPDGKKIREKYGIAESEIVLLLVCRLTEEKNVEFVFRSISGVFKENRNKKVRLMVAGDGYLREKLEEFCAQEKIASSVIFCGVVVHSELKNYYAAADIFVYGSTSETQGMIISEAMYAGLPIVAVNATGTRSLVINKGNGFLTSENEKEFSRLTRQLIQDEELRKKFGETSARIARAQFTSQVCAKKLLEVYREAIQQDLTK